MANPNSTSRVWPAKTLSYDDLYLTGQVTTYFVGEPERSPDKGAVPQAVKRLARNVRLLRVSRGWSQEALAEIAELDRSFVGAIERAERNITLATAEKIAKVFDIMCSSSDLN